MLHSMGLHVFLDKDALDAGDCIPAEIQHAITTATLHIAIFSLNYAQSPWCLSELTFMLKTGGKIIPIFYHVDPSDLRWVEKGKGKYAQAFSEYENKGRYTPDKLDEWKGALHKISFLSGYLVNNNQDEATGLKNIVNRALKIMKKAPLWVAEHPLGLDELVQGFELVAGEEEVKITGIVGMGGSGKTTFAKELYNRNFSFFEKRSFVFDVRDAASRNALLDKQKKLLNDLGVHHLPFDHVDEGKAVLANHLSSHRALIVLDDVDDVEQLKALLPNKDNLGSQSMVIVTTRERGALTSWGLSCIYRMPGLETSLAQQLFCWHAFLQPSPPAEFETLVQEFLKACKGLPLSLKVLGAQLYGRKSIAYWKSQLNKILRILPGEIEERLQVSYDALDEEEREMFLDVACFFIEECDHTAIAVWDGSGWSGLHGLETLVNKCLVELHEDTYHHSSGIPVPVVVSNRIRMHDHLRDMGREIASRQSPNRLWCPKQIDDMKKHSTEGKSIRGIRSGETFLAFKEYTHQLMRSSNRRYKRLRFSNEIKILSVIGNEFTEELASLSEDLVWLRWYHFPLRNLPSWLRLKNLSVLELHAVNRLEELWQDNADLPSHLRELILHFCPNLQCLPSSIKHLRDLKRLDVNSDCTSGLGPCYWGLRSLPDSFGNLTSLEFIKLNCPRLSMLPHSFGNLTSLREINLMGCRQLSMLPDSFSQLINLESLNLLECIRLSSLPNGFGNLTSLKNIDLGNCAVSMLPDSFSQLIHLEFLNLSRCEMLSSLPNDFGNLTSLKNINLTLCMQLSMLPDSFSQLINLEILKLSRCERLSSLPNGFGNLTSLKNIALDNCTKLSMLPDSFSQLIHLEFLYLRGCEVLSSLPNDVGNLTSLKNIDLTLCYELRKLSMLPDSFSQLIHLESLKLGGFEIVSLPNGFGNLKSLKDINLSYLSQLRMLPDSFSQLIHLKSLNLCFCEMLVSLPETLPINLESLKIDGCVQIEELPSFAGLASLNTFIMRGCPEIEKIEGLEHAKSLKLLEVQTWWKVPGILSLDNVERLEELQLECDTISALKPCIQSLKGKECPKRMLIQGSAIRLVEPIVKSLGFPDLAVKEVENRHDIYVTSRPEHLDAFLCSVEENDKKKKYYSREWGSRAEHLDAFLCYMEENDKKKLYYSREEWGYYRAHAVFRGCKLRVVQGKRERVEEFFYQLLENLE